MKHVDKIFLRISSDGKRLAKDARESFHFILPCTFFLYSLNFTDIYTFYTFLLTPHIILLSSHPPLVLSRKSFSRKSNRVVRVVSFSNFMSAYVSTEIHTSLRFQRKRKRDRYRDRERGREREAEKEKRIEVVQVFLPQKITSALIYVHLSEKMHGSSKVEENKET